ncbi:MAG: cell division protein FtsQ/DivIB [Candidatus Brocadiia bacterium]
MCARNRKLARSRRERLRRAAQWVGGRMRTGLAAVGLRGFLVAVLVAAALAGVRVARREVGQRRKFRVYPHQFRARAPAWCADDLAEVRFPRSSYSIFDPRLTREVAEAYLASPWVVAVTKVEKRFPNILRVELELRHPAALVRRPEGDYPIDPRGVRLPLGPHQRDHLSHPLPLIFGARSEPPSAGQQWAGRGVRAAVAVLGALAAEPDILRQIYLVDVSNLDGEIDPLRSEVLLFTTGRVRILWGRPPDTTKCGEPPVEDKMARLRRELANPLALADSGATINLRFPDDDAIARQ